MTDSEKAEKSLKKRKGEYWCIKTDNVYIPYTEGYKDGLAEGRKEKWHNLRENPNDLPKEGGEFWTKWEDGTYSTAHYFADNGFGDYVIAWTELPMFEE